MLIFGWSALPVGRLWGTLKVVETPILNSNVRDILTVGVKAGFGPRQGVRPPRAHTEKETQKKFMCAIIKNNTAYFVIFLLN